MATNYRRRSLGLAGQIQNTSSLTTLGSGLAQGDTSLSSDGLALLPVVGTDEYFVLVIDEDGEYGNQEVVYVTAHSVNSTAATILRGQEGTTARDHPQDVYWGNNPTTYDFGEMPWTSFTPTLTNFTIGNGTIVGKFRHVGKALYLRYYIAGGSTTSTSAGAHTLSLPSPFVTPNDGYVQGGLSGVAYESGVSWRRVHGNVAANASVVSLLLDDNGTSEWSGTTPMDFGNSDWLTLGGVLEVQ